MVTGFTNDFHNIYKVVFTVKFHNVYKLNAGFHIKYCKVMTVINAFEFFNFNGYWFLDMLGTEK